MATVYQVPGVYIEEKPAGSKPIQGVGTSTAAFIGFTEKRPNGNTGQPHFVASWNQFTDEFGGFVDGFHLPPAVYGYFLNGGRSCYIQSLATAEDHKRAMQGRPSNVLLTTQSQSKALELRSKAEGSAAQGITVEVSNATGEGTEEQFKITIKAPNHSDEPFDNLTMGKGRNTRNAVEVLNRESTIVQALEGDLTGTLVERRPKNGTYQLTAMADAPLATADTFKGNVTERTGIGALAEIDDITLVICPDLMSVYERSERSEADKDALIGVQQALLNHCETMKDRFAILDAPPDLSPIEVKQWKTERAMFNSKYGAIYYPWIEIANPNGKNGDKRTLKVPPSGHIAGVYARVDQERGVHKAPANEPIRGAIKLERKIIDSEQAELNPKGINCIRAFTGRGILIWGARTLTDDTEWQYINVRRLFNFIEESIYEGTQWVVFEPNDMDLWERVKRTVTAFLTRVWRDGALFGATPEEAFYVKCDASNNPEADRRLGILRVEVGVAPVMPAEFVRFTFTQISDGGGGVSE